MIIEHNKKNIFFFVSACFFIFFSESALLSAVTYTFSGGRFGDCLLSYCHAKWIAYKYNIPLLYKPFTYSDQLVMDRAEIHYSAELEEQFQKVVTYSEVDGQIDPQSGYLYVVPFFCESIFNINDPDFPFLFTVDWKDPDFKAVLKRMIAPVIPTKKLPLPSKCICVAVHIRKGTGWDIPVYKITPEELTASHPLRFAPDSYFIAQLHKMLQLFPDQRIYAYLFTDHNDPAQIAQLYKSALRSDRVVFNYRKSENNEFINVLDDFFALTQFNCLIRPDSNFSIVASKLGDYKVMISPWHGIVQANNTTIIDEIAIELDNESCIVQEECEGNFLNI